MLMLNVLTEKVLGYQMMLNVLGRSGPLVNVAYPMFMGTDLIVPVNRTGSCGMIASLLLSSSRGTLLVSFSST